MRSHPPTLLTLAARMLRELGIGPGARILVAVSGGPDSMALLHVLARLREKRSGKRNGGGFALVAHGVDHGLRASAAAELDGAAALAASLEVPFARTRVDVAPGGNLQARARDARYAALARAATDAGATSIATAHHMEDRAETLLLRLLRGAGPAGLAVLPPRAPLPRAIASSLPSAPAAHDLELVRPFLRASRAAIDAHLERHAIAFAVDPSNRDPRFARARVRHELLPLLRALSPAVVTHLCALADQLAELPHAPAIPALSTALSRGSRDALKKALRDRSTKSRIRLPGGLVATYVRTHASDEDHLNEAEDLSASVTIIPNAKSRS